MVSEPESTPTEPAEPESAESGGAPWLESDTQSRLRWRDGDVVVSVPLKSGTTWTMNIVHQLRSGGDADFGDLYVEVPWLELVERPGQTPEERLAKWDAMTHARRRAFKSHAAPPVLPYVEPGDGRPDVRYVVVVRNPEEVAVSIKPFIERHSPELFERWQVPPATFTRDDFASFYEERIEPAGMLDGIYRLLNAWWPLRERSNVLFLHFGELKADPDGSVRRIADFLGFDPTPQQWPVVLEHCSFNWMKAHQRKFELQEVAGFPILQPGAMIRKGKVGSASEDGMTPAIAARVRAHAAQQVIDPVALRWLYDGPEA